MRATDLFRSLDAVPGSELRFEQVAADHLRLTSISNPDGTSPSLVAPSPNTSMSAQPHPRNLILYGPPGTGKTHATARLAVEIIDGSPPDDRTALMARYNELREREQIGFVTFHQSYSYEEFVEGIRPVLDADGDDGSDVRYECRPGAFRTLCDLASTKQTGRAARGSVAFENAKFWKMSLGETKKRAEDFIFEEAIEKGTLMLGYGLNADYSDCPDKLAIEKRMREVFPDRNDDSSFAAEAVHRLKNRMSIGDIVIVSYGNLRFRAIGRITGDYYFVEAKSTWHRRDVEWLLVAEDPIPRERVSSKIFSQQTIHELQRKNLDLAAISALIEAPTGDTIQNHVLIIDEINRGNISKILGELITLLEPNKRIGSPEALRATLPYSGEKFGVPDNLYIIGTMNTSDRSIALMDTALRRRFEFREMEPDPEVIRAHVGEDGVVDGIDITRVLTVLNERIEYLYDRDHRLGHSFFLGITSLADLRTVTVNQVVPMLQEYFYDDMDKVCAVLACSADPSESTRLPHPILRATALKPPGLAEDLLDERSHVEVSRKFLDASQDELRRHFAALLSPEA